MVGTFDLRRPFSLDSLFRNLDPDKGQDLRFPWGVQHFHLSCSMPDPYSLLRRNERHEEGVLHALRLRSSSVCDQPYS